MSGPSIRAAAQTPQGVEHMKEKVLTRGLVLCTVCALFYSMMFFMFFTGISSYSDDFFGTSSTVAGIVVSTFVIGDLLARGYFGRRMNLVGKKRLSVIALGICTAVSASYLVVDSLAVFIVIRIVQGFCYGAASSAVNTLVTEQLPASRRGEGLGYFMLSMSLGSAIGPFLCMWLLNNVSYDSVFIVGTVFSLLALVMVLGVSEVRREYTPEEIADMRSIKLSNYYEKAALPVSIVCFVLFFSYSGVLSFMSPYGTEIGMETAASVFFIFISTTTLISRLFLCKITDTRGDNMAIIPFFLLFVAGYFMLATAETPAVLLAAGLLMGFNIAQYVSVGQAAAVRNSPKERYGVAVSTFSIFLDLSYVAGPMVHGFLIGELGYRDDFLIMACVSGLALIMYVFLHGIREHHRMSSLG